MFERFNEDARRCVVTAQQEAIALHARKIGTEHLLLGVLTGPFAATLAGHGVALDPDTVRGLVVQSDDGYDGSRPFSNNAKRALELALREALQQGSSEITERHLLVGMLRRPCTAAVLLAGAGVDVNALRVALSEREEPESSLAPATPGAKPERPAKAVKVLEAFGTNLCQQARDGKLDAVIGRDAEIMRCVQVLGRRGKANPVLIGEAGVGKTAIVEGIAQAIVDKTVPEHLWDVDVWAIDLGSMLAGTRLRGDFEERIKALLKAASESNVVLFVDEIHAALGIGSGESGGVDAASQLKPALARGEIRLIGATTLDEYRKVEKDKALERRLSPVTVSEPDETHTIAMLEVLRDRYEDHHHLVCDDEALRACVTLTGRYLPDRRWPDKAIDALDETLAHVRIHNQPPESNLRELRDTVVRWTQAQRHGHDGNVYDADVPDALDADEARAALVEQAGAWHITAADVAHTISVMTGVPISVDADEATRLLHLEDVLHERVKGQDTAVGTVARALRRVRAGLGDRRRVGGSFLFVGPTGVGKTELARTLAREVFGKDEALVQIDMSEYMEAHSVSRLVGSPPGYVGHGEGGQLTEAVRRQPYSVVLLDEIEKAHPDVLNVLLQLLEEGRLTDAQGRKVDFSNTIVIATSNLGTAELARPKLGFSHGSAKADSEVVMAAVRKALRPELIGRIDDIVVFDPLTPDQIAEIAKAMTAAVAARLAELGITVELTEAALAQLAAAGYDPSLGARPLRRVVQRLVEDRLSNALLGGEIRAGQLVVLDAGDDDLTLSALDGVAVAAPQDVPVGA